MFAAGTRNCVPLGELSFFRLCPDHDDGEIEEITAGKNFVLLQFQRLISIASILRHGDVTCPAFPGLG